MTESMYSVGAAFMRPDRERSQIDGLGEQCESSIDGMHDGRRG